MADVTLLAPLVRKWEGKFVDDPTDRGGATNMGITLNTWRAVGYDKDGDGDIDTQDIKLLSPDDFTKVLKQYWDRWKADRIINQSVANILVDWVWQSGKWGIKIPQRVMHLIDDGVAGEKTLAAVNTSDAKILFAKIYQARERFFDDIIVHDPSQKKFIKGWKNRLADFKFMP